MTASVEPENLLDRFRHERAQARRFHGQTLGNNVDAEHCLGDFLCRLKDRDRAGIEKHYRAAATKGASNLSEVSGPLGGYLVPQDLAAGVFADLSTGSRFRRYGAQIVPMQSEQTNLAVVDVSRAVAAGVAPYFGALQMTWQSAGATFLDSVPYFRDLNLTAGILGGYFYASNPLLQDAVALNSLLENLLADALGWYQDQAFFNGNGAGKPQGVTVSPAVRSVTRATANTIAAADVQAMIDAMLPSSYSRAVWFAHPTTLSQLTALPNWIPNGDLRLFGRPIEPEDKCAFLGSKGDLMLIDPSLYVIGDREQIEIDFSAHEPISMLANKSAFRVWSRVAGQSLLAAPIQLPNGSTSQTVSPFVILNSNPPT